MKPRLEYQPALDGVRAVAVAMVLLFHGGVDWMGGGYIGVSVFFTLSGYLITSLLLAESDATGVVRVGAFLARRARRLLPASVVCIVGVAVCSRYGLLDGVADLERDLLGAAFQVQNWVLLASGDSYTEVLATVGGQRSPLEHYWSLAIEEQFYWMWPLVFGWLATRDRARLKRRLAGLTVTAMAAAPLIAIAWGADAAYWATPARLAEILLGAWLAVVLAGRPLADSWAPRVAPLALGALVVAAVLLPADGGPMYRGGLPLIGVASALLIVGLQGPSPIRRLLGLRPLVVLGRISYGVYLFHWPVYVILDEVRADLTGPALLGLRLAVTGIVAATSYVLIERPIRSADWRPRPTLAGAVFATAAIVAVSVVVPVTIATDYWRAAPGDIAALAATASRATPYAIAPSVAPSTSSSTASSTPIPSSTVLSSPTIPTTTATTTATTSTPTSGPVRVLLVGDSTAEALGVGLAGWASANPALADVRLAVSPGCGFVRGGEVATDGDVPFGPRCDEILDRVLPATLVDFHPDVVMLLSSTRDLTDRRWSNEEGTIDPFDEPYRRRIDRDYARIAGLVTATGATAVFVRGPLVDPFWLGRETMSNYRERRAVVDGVMDRLATEAGSVRVLDLRAWVESIGIAESHEARPDGVHWAPDVAFELAQGWLGPTLLSIARPS
ncbi:MAG TPA: acyltransferase family protein [Ilumatobacteraceae bacterium]|nr:acyltransferase family protein [Ilumatobacteraceae bacterium]